MSARRLSVAFRCLAHFRFGLMPCTRVSWQAPGRATGRRKPIHGGSGCDVHVADGPGPRPGACQLERGAASRLVATDWARAVQPIRHAACAAIAVMRGVPVCSAGNDQHARRVDASNHAKCNEAANQARREAAQCLSAIASNKQPKARSQRGRVGGFRIAGRGRPRHGRRGRSPQGWVYGVPGQRSGSHPRV